MAIEAPNGKERKPPLRVAVIGAGGVGGYYGARLALGGAEVSFLARGAHLEAIRRVGIRVDHDIDPFQVRDLRATDNAAEIGSVDVVMICVKLGDTHAALDQIHTLVGRSTTVVSFQNGVLKDSILQAAFDPRRVIGGVAYIASTVSAPGVIARTGRSERLVFGEFDGSRSERVESLLAACLSGGISAEVSTDILKATWQKFVFIVGLSATTTTMGLAIGHIRNNPRTRAFLLNLMHEVVVLARARGVGLPQDYADRCLEFVDGLAPGMTSSMAHDFARGNKLELPWLSGAVVELGLEFGVETPLNRAVADILALHSNGKESI